MANPVRCSSEQIKSMLFTAAGAKSWDSWVYLSTPEIIGYCPATVASAAIGALWVKMELAALPKPTGSGAVTWTEGDALYYDYGNSIFTNVSGITSSFMAGVCEAGAASADSTGLAFFDSYVHKFTAATPL